MNLTRILSCIAAVAVFMVAPSASAKGRISFTEGETVSLSAFTGLAVKGGGIITVSPGSSHSVRVVEGGERVELFMDGGSLRVECARPCRGNVRRVLEVTTPAVSEVAIAGGGIITFEAGFAAQDELNTAIVGGGTLNALNLSAAEVNAAVTGGGSISVTATRELNAAIIGGGSIVYAGNPPDVNPSVIGGGSISER